MPLLLFNFSTAQITAALLVASAIAIIIAFLWRIKDQLRVTETLQPQESCYEEAYKLIPDGVLVLNSDNKFMYINPAAEKMLGRRLRSLMGRSYKDAFSLLHLRTERTLQGVFNDDLSRGQKPKTYECILETTRDQSFPIALDIIPLTIHNSADEIPHSLFFFKNITERRVIETKLSDLEKYDTLTRVLNRRSFEAEVKHVVESSHKHDSKHVLAYFSVDQFHTINNVIGYSGGDSLIIKMGEIISSHIRSGVDIVGKVGEDEFAVIFQDQKLIVTIKRIQAIIDDVKVFEFISMGKIYPITMSAGFIVVDSSSTSSARVIAEAKAACHSAKEAGDNQLAAYKPNASDVELQEGYSEWVTVLKDAIRNNHFYMHAQPIHPLRKEEYTQPFYHYELLIRLTDERGNPIYPNEFLAAAEYYSMMPDIDRWVVRTVLREVSKIPEQLPLPVFAINLSGQSLNDASFLDFVINEVKNSEVDPQMLCFEITEQVAVEDLNLVNGFISSLKSLGSKFSLDDFGTGVSSYGYLRSLDVDYLKIDGSFVKNIVDDDVAKAMVQSINYVGHTMNLKVIAEYVENDEILELLRAMGVDYGQGYQILRPIPFGDVLKQHIKTEESEYYIES